MTRKRNCSTQKG